jgi:hypothetical protein
MAYNTHFRSYCSVTSKCHTQFRSYCSVTSKCHTHFLSYSSVTCKCHTQFRSYCSVTSKCHTQFGSYCSVTSNFHHHIPTWHWVNAIEFNKIFLRKQLLLQDIEFHWTLQSILINIYTTCFHIKIVLYFTHRVYLCVSFDFHKQWLFL